MSSRALPGLGLNGFWSLGEDGWKDGMDSNLRVLSVLVSGSFKDFVSSVPGSPANGDIYILNSGANVNKLAVYDVSAWIYLTPKKGALCYSEATASYFTFNGDAWNALTAEGTTNPDYQSSVRIACGPTEGNIDWETGGLLTLQGVALADGDPVLLFAQDNAAENLIYLARSGAWDRQTGWEDHADISSGTIVPIDEGTFGGLIYQLITPNPIDISVTELTWKNNSRIGRTNFASTNKNGDYTLTSVDNRRWIYANKSGAQTFTIPTFAAEAIPPTAEIIIQSVGTGTKTITASAGVKINGVTAGSVALTSIWTAYWLKQRVKNQWVAIPIGGSGTAYTNEDAQDAIAAAFAAGTHTGITITYNDAANSFDFAVSSTYSDEQAQDAVAAMLTAGTGISMAYNDAANTLTISASGTTYTDEMARDAIGAAMVGGTGITVTPNDGADTITIGSTITQYTDEMAQDAIAAAFAAGTQTGLTITYNDVSNSFDFSSTGSYSDEQAMDAVSAMFLAGTHTGISFSYNDASDSFSATVTSGTVAASTAEILAGTDNSKMATALNLQAFLALGANVASSSSPTIGDGRAWNITGTTAITGLTVTDDFPGRVFLFKFTGSLTLTHNSSSFILPGGEDIKTQAGDTAIFVSLGSGNYQCWNYNKNSTPFYSELGAQFGGAGTVIAAGGFMEYRVPFDCTIKEATAIVSPSGSITIDVYVCSYSNYDGGSSHPVSGDKITGSNPIAVSSSTKYSDTSLSGWTTTLNKGDIVRFIVTGTPATVTQATAMLMVKRK